jgi:hypothetical protein
MVGVAGVSSASGRFVAGRSLLGGYHCVYSFARRHELGRGATRECTGGANGQSASGHCLVIGSFNQRYNILGPETEEQVMEFASYRLDQGSSRSFAVLRVVDHGSLYGMSALPPKAAYF